MAVSPKEPWFGTGVAMTLAGCGLLGLTWQAWDPQNPKPYISWMSVGSVLLMGSGVVMAVATSGLRRPRLPTLPPFLHRQVVDEGTAPGPDVPKWVALLPLVIDGQLRMTLRSRRRLTDDGDRTQFYFLELEVEGPDGTFTNKPDGGHAGYFDGVYMAQYPRSFAAATLRPGRYVMRWFARNATGGVDEAGHLMFGDRIPQAELAVRVTDDWQVVPA